MSNFPQSCVCSEPGKCHATGKDMSVRMWQQCQVNGRYRLTLAVINKIPVEDVLKSELLKPPTDKLMPSEIPPQQGFQKNKKQPEIKYNRKVKKASTPIPLPQLRPECQYFGPKQLTCGIGDPLRNIHWCLNEDAELDRCWRSPLPPDRGIQSCQNCSHYSILESQEPVAAPAPVSVGEVIKWDEKNLWSGQEGLRFNSSLITDRQGGYFFAYRTGWKGSDIYVGRMTKDFIPVGKPVRLDLHHKRCSYGREDPRLFWYQGQLHCSFIGVIAKPVSKLATSVFYCRLRDDLTVDRLFYPHYEHRNPWEKNWQFFEYGDELFAVYSIAPHKILRIKDDHAEMAFESPTPAPWGPGTEMRGGSSPILIGDEWWSFFHSRYPNRVYMMGAYTFENYPPFRIRRITPEPIKVADPVTKPKDQYTPVIFPCGSVLNGDTWTVSCGVHDRWTEFHSFSKKEIEDRMLPIQIEFRDGSNDDLIFQAVNQNDEYRLGGTTFKEDDVVIDIGGHVGSFMFNAWMRGSRRIESYEANLGNFTLLQKNSELLSGVTCHRTAVWSETGKKVFSHEQVHFKEVNHGGRWVSDEQYFDNENLEDVVSTSLDDILVKHESVAFLKMDIERSEFQVIPNSKLLGRVKRMAIEFHDHPEPLEAYLKSFGFKVEVVRAADNIQMGLIYAVKS